MERSSSKFDAGMYNVLGGHMEKGEDVIESANREILEESGIKPIKTKLAGIVHVSDFFGKDVLMFITRSDTNELDLKESDEGRLVWVDLNKIDSYKIYEDVKPFLKRILESDELFIGTSKFDGKGILLELKLKNL